MKLLRDGAYRQLPELVAAKVDLAGFLGMNEDNEALPLGANAMVMKW